MSKEKGKVHRDRKAHMFHKVRPVVHKGSMDHKVEPKVILYKLDNIGILPSRKVHIHISFLDVFRKHKHSDHKLVSA